MDSPDQDKPEVIEARMTAALKRALATKPEPHKKPSPTPPKQRRGGLGEKKSNQG